MEINCIEYEFRKKDLIDCFAHEFRKRDFTYAFDILSDKSIHTFDTKQKKLSDNINVAPFQILATSSSLSSFTVFYFVLMLIAVVAILSMAPWPSEHRFVFIIFGILFGSLGLALLFAVLFFVRILAFWVVSRALKRNDIIPQYFSHHRLAIKEDYLELQYGTTCMQRYYTAIQKIIEYPKCSIILCTPLNRIVVPHKAFANARQRSYFFKHLQSTIVQAKSANISTYSIEENRESNFVVKFAWDEQNFINALTKCCRLKFTTRLGWSIGQIICTLIGIAFFYQGIILLVRHYGASNNYPYLFISSLFGLFIGYLFLSSLILTFTPLLKRVFKGQIENGIIIPYDFIGPQEICFKDDRIRELRHMSSTDLMYEAIYCVKQDSANVYILPKKEKVIPIPNSAFYNDYQKQEIINFVKYKIQQK